MRQIARVPTRRVGSPIVWIVLAAMICAIAVSCSRSSNPQDQGDPAPTATTAAQVVVPPGTTPAVPGVDGQRILFGQSAAFSGPAQELGRGMQLGIRAAFFEANRRGGVHGRQLELVSVDDAYEPELAVANTNQLIEDDGVFALIGAVGTPTARSSTPITAEAGVPYIAPFTGAGFLREAEWTNVVNLRASYNQETEEMVARLVNELGLFRIGVLHQDDSFGRSGLYGVLAALNRRGIEAAAVAVYPRNTSAVKTALLELRQRAPDAIIMIGAYEPVASFVAWSRQLDMDPVFMTVSFVGSNALADELGPDGVGVFVTQVVPSPLDGSIPVVEAYRNALSAYDADAVPGFVSFEGYLAGRLAIAGLDRCGADVDRTCFLAGLRRDELIDIDGFILDFGENDNQGSDAVFLTVIGEDGVLHPITTLRGAEPSSRS